MNCARKGAAGRNFAPRRPAFASASLLVLALRKPRPERMILNFEY